MAESHTEEASVVSSSVDVGKRLRDAREAKSLSIIDVAAQIRVTRESIENLEEQNWERLHGRTYARGYFLSYVRFLGLPQDEMLAGFNIEFNETEKRTPSIAPIQQIKLSKPAFPWFSIILLIIVGGLAWLAYQQWQLQQNATPAEDIATQPQVTQEPSESLDTDNNVNRIPITNADEAPANVIVEEPIVQEQIVQEPAETIAVEPEPTPVEEAPATTETIEVEQPEPLTTEAEANQKSLIIGLNADCWVEVRDANQQVLISRVVRSGNTVELTGTSPLRVSLGQATAASVRFDGNIVDISGYTRGNVARFTLGEDS